MNLSITDFPELGLASLQVYRELIKKTTQLCSVRYNDLVTDEDTQRVFSMIGVMVSTRNTWMSLGDTLVCQNVWV